MRIGRDEDGMVVHAVETAFDGHDAIVLAVSGGLDSMVMLHTAAAIRRRGKPRLVAATFDHRTGAHSARASKLVRTVCAAYRVRCVARSAQVPSTSENAWRSERWTFLAEVSQKVDAPVATAHTLDDQIETVFMRILRDSGPRGLAALFAASDHLRPFLGLARSDLARYASAHRVRFCSDPSNGSRLHLRNRVRHDLLPAITSARPSFSQEILEVSRAAAEWREAMAAAADMLPTEEGRDGSLRISRNALAGYDVPSLRALWPALAAKANVVMDRRGTDRLAEFTLNGRTGGAIQLSGGIEVRMHRDHLLLRRWDATQVELLRRERLNPVARQRRALGA